MSADDDRHDRMDAAAEAAANGEDLDFDETMIDETVKGAEASRYFDGIAENIADERRAESVGTEGVDLAAYDDDGLPRKSHISGIGKIKSTLDDFDLIAELFLQRVWTDEITGARTLMCVSAGEYLGWSVTRHMWIPVSREWLTSMLKYACADAYVEAASGEQKNLRLSRVTEGNIIRAIERAVPLRDRTKPQAWLTTGVDGDISKGGPYNCLACDTVPFRNGLLVKGTPDDPILTDAGMDETGARMLMPHTPLLYNTDTKVYDYVTWESLGYRKSEPFNQLLRSMFTSSLGTVDWDSIQKLKAVIGYLITNDKQLEQMFILLGNPGTGKSVLLRVIEQLVGTFNAVWIRMADLGNAFGLDPVRGKNTVFMDDEQEDMKDKALNGTAVMRLLSMCTHGKDIVNRKNKDMEPIQYDQRIVMAVNAIPSFLDTTGAMRRRMSIFKLQSDTIPAAQRDGALMRKILLDLEVVAAECLAAYDKWLEESSVIGPDGHPIIATKMPETEAGKAELDSYSEDASPARTFLRTVFEMTENHEDDYVPGDYVLVLYQRWRQRMGYEELYGMSPAKQRAALNSAAQTALSSVNRGAMKSVGYVDGKRRQKRSWTGLRVKEEWVEPLAADGSEWVM